MAVFDWSPEENRKLVEERGISLHPDQKRYPGQMIYVVDIEQYLHLVPFVIEPDGTRFLKTIIPSRKAMREYRRRPP